jgi:hypothetical protein
MKPRQIIIDGIVTVLEGCGACPCIGVNDEMGDEWCQHPAVEQGRNWIDKEAYENPEDVRKFEVFPKFCPLKER